MTPQPKKKLSKIRQGLRAAQLKVKIDNLMTCPNCGGLKRSHEYCRACGKYKNHILRTPKVETRVTKVTK